MGEIDIFKLIIQISALLVAIIGHEIMHGLIALLYGDESAKIEGRLSLNPIKHIDLLGSIIIPLALFLLKAPFLFGWAKPVPVDIRKVIENGGYNAAIFVSLAGILYNLTIAIIASIIIKLVFGGVDESNLASAILFSFLLYLVIYNIVLAVFNLLPIPPLDGSQALGYLSLKFNSDKIPLFFNKIERFGIFILFGILLIPSLSQIIFIPIQFLVRILL
ncbi:MAG: site-2 protease family protein [Helicobacteraceae bacterium]|nr:site-2 protease family protein [Helicobacteraceae bacterium]